MKMSNLYMLICAKHPHANIQVSFRELAKRTFNLFSTCLTNDYMLHAYVYINEINKIIFAYVNNFGNCCFWHEKKMQGYNILI